MFLKDEIDHFKFQFIIIYFPNSGAERSLFFKKFKNIVKEENEYLLL